MNYHDIMSALPPFQEEDLSVMIKSELKKANKTIIVLDDDPTGTQTMHGVPVLTSWDEESIEKEVCNGSGLFYILTNSRSMGGVEADELHRLIGSHIASVFNKYGREFILVSRGDSTLRGHFPGDIVSLAVGLQMEQYYTAVIPAFFEGGRYTIQDVHYVKEEAYLIPAAETTFAQDKAFGFSNSDLKKWIEEKSKGLIAASDVVSFSLKELREDSAEFLAKKISSMPSGSTCIVNAASYFDLEKFALAYLQSGVPMLFRTAASFVKAISGTEKKSLLSKQELVMTKNANGGLIVAGSYVPKTTSQLNELFGVDSLHAEEIDVTKVLSKELKVSEIIDKVDACMAAGKDVVVYTSRVLQSGKSEIQSLAIGNEVSDFLTALVAGLSVVPKFIIAKGGITSSDIATKSIGIRRAIVLGQALPGVPVWQAGPETKFPGMSYIIFPGNVGDSKALADLYHKLVDS